MRFLERSIILISSYIIALNGYDLSPSEMRGYFVCDYTKTGVSIWSFPIAYSVNLSHTLGEKNIVSTSNGAKSLEWKIYGINKAPQLIINLKKIDSGEYKNDNVTCYEIEKISNENKNFLIEKKDLTPELMVQMAIFGWPLGSKEDIRQKQAKDAAFEVEAREREKAIEQERQDQREREILLERKQLQLQEERRIAKEKELTQQKELRNQRLNEVKDKNIHVLSIWKTFLEKYQISDLVENRKCVMECSLKEIIINEIFLQDIQTIYENINTTDSKIPNVEQSIIIDKITEFLRISPQNKQEKLHKQRNILDHLSIFDQELKRHIKENVIFFK